MNGTFRIGARGSALSMIQAEKVRSALMARFHGLSVTVEPIKTKGDMILDSPLSKIGGKGLFIREIEDALLSTRIDAAVHSLKDLPTVLPEGLILGGVLPREDPRDALVSRDGRTLAQLGARDSVGTSSLRRRAQLLMLNRDLQVVDIRGNVDTRLRKIGEGSCSAIVLAACGLVRAGYSDRITTLLDPDQMLPAVSQGIIGIEIRGEDGKTAELVEQISDSNTFRTAEAERAFLHRLEGGCQVPIGCLCSIQGAECAIDGLITDLDGVRAIRKSVRGKASDILNLAERLADAILDEGGAEILDEIRSER